MIGGKEMNGGRGCVYMYVCANHRFDSCSRVELINRSVQKGVQRLVHMWNLQCFKPDLNVISTS